MGALQRETSDGRTSRAGPYTSAVAAFASGLTLDAIGEQARDATKQILADSFACMLAGASLEAVERASRAARALTGAQGGAIVVGTDERVAPSAAAFANGSSSHALNFDANGPHGGHVGLVALAPALAAASILGDPLTGPELLVAAAAAIEIAERLTTAARSAPPSTIGLRDHGWLIGQVIGAISSAAGAARLLRLDPDMTASAIGLALMQASGTKQVMVEGDVSAKAIYGGFACQAGLTAAVCAREGVEAEMSALEGEAGLVRVFFGASASVLGEALGGLGERFAAETTICKRWPASGVVQPFVDAALRLRERGFTQRIGKVRICAPAAIRDWLEPVEARRHPANAAAASNSVQYATACALSDGSLTVDRVLRPARTGPIATLAARVHHEFGMRAAVVLQMEDGREEREDCWAANSGPDEAMALQKAVDSNRAAPRPYSENELKALLHAFRTLESVDDVSKLLSRHP